MIELRASQDSIKANITLSGSKSISNRLLILCHLLKQKTIIQNLSLAEDTQLLLAALDQINKKTINIIDIGHAGTDMRFLTALLSITEGEWTLTGSSRMKERPIGELVNALKQLGAEITYLEKENYPPLSIQGKKLMGGQVEVDSSISSQFISALLLIGAFLENGLCIDLRGEAVSVPYIQMTISILKEFGINIHQTKNKIIVDAIASELTPPSMLVESDWSSASYWFSICSLSKNAEITLSLLNKSSIQADSVLPELYENLGVHTTYSNNTVHLKSKSTAIKQFNYDFSSCPDIAQTLAVTCLAKGIRVNFTGLHTLKVKETNRIIALKNELEKFGAIVSVTDNSLSITDYRFQIQDFTTKKKSPIKLASYQDHRMALSFAPIAMVCNSLLIDEASVINKSYPSFWEDLKSVGFNVNLLP